MILFNMVARVILVGFQMITPQLGRINVEEFKILIQVCLNKKFKLKYCCISKLLPALFLTYYFCFQTITIERFFKTNFNSVYAGKLIFVTNIKVEFVDKVDPH